MTATEAKREQDRDHLRRALELAERGRGRVSPNPLVGAVIARGGDVLGEGWHAELGGDHAEVAAIADARSRGADLDGATMYVTLEPCAHHGRTPPCTDAILATPIGRVVIASEDPSEKASGRGPGMLRDDGRAVELAQGAEATAARLLNQAFRKHSRTGLPLVTLKMASSLDGKVATRGGDSKWISGERSRALVHRWRAESDAVAVGIGTALADDALLTARDLHPPAALQPARVVFDSTARLPLDSKLVASIPEAPLYVVTGPDAPADRAEALRAAGAELIAADLPGALAELGRRGITSVLLEGGPTLAGSFLDAGEIDQLRLFLAPVLIGGAEASPIVSGLGAERVELAARALAMSAEPSGEDVLITARLKEW
ncbi:MAG TPA: bifunctional diaminohydroxyphosphoribosylaminopyrimidine deaminase/5-amino-6-(5-phosphoribosylamino)uracil reductase RibD [Solirubrobacterales bacterium]